MHPLVRWQFRGLQNEEDRKAFLFTNITDSKGRKFDIPVLVGGLAGNRAIYSIGMQCSIEDVRDKWIKAMTHPIPPKVVDQRALPGDRLQGQGPPATATALTTFRCRSRRPAGTTRRT